MKVKSDDILNISFSGSLFGYDRKEVDAFLDDTAEEMRALEHEKAEMQLAIDALMKKLERLSAQREAAQGSERETDVPRKGTPYRDKKAPIPLNKKKTAGKTVEEETDVPAAPSRHINRGAGERSKRSTPAFLRPQPFPGEGPLEEDNCVSDAQDIETGQIAAVETVKTEAQDAGIYIRRKTVALCTQEGETDGNTFVEHSVTVGTAEIRQTELTVSQSEQQPEEENK